MHFHANLGPLALARAEHDGGLWIRGRNGSTPTMSGALETELASPEFTGKQQPGCGGYYKQRNHLLPFHGMKIRLKVYRRNKSLV